MLTVRRSKNIVSTALVNSNDIKAHEGNGIC